MCESLIDVSTERYCDGGVLYSHQSHALAWLRHRERRRQNNWRVRQCLPTGTLSATEFPNSNRSSDPPDDQSSTKKEEDFQILWITDTADPLSFFSIWRELRLVPITNKHVLECFEKTSGAHLNPDFSDSLGSTKLSSSNSLDNSTHRFVVVNGRTLYGLTTPPNMIHFAGQDGDEISSGFSLFLNRAENQMSLGFSSSTDRKAIQWDGGGLFCDEPGLGKTLSVLSLILKSDPSDNRRDDVPTHSHLVNSISASFVELFFSKIGIVQSVTHFNRPSPSNLVSSLPSNPTVQDRSKNCSTLIPEDSLISSSVSDRISKIESNIPTLITIPPSDSFRFKFPPISSNWKSNSPQLFPARCCDPPVTDLARRTEDFRPTLPLPLEVSLLQDLVNRGDVLGENLLREVETRRNEAELIRTSCSDKSLLGSTQNGPSSYDDRSEDDHSTKRRRVMQQLGADESWRCFDFQNKALELHLNAEEKKVRRSLELAESLVEKYSVGTTKPQLYGERSEQISESPVDRLARLLSSIPCVPECLEGNATLVVTPNNLVSRYLGLNRIQ